MDDYDEYVDEVYEDIVDCVHEMKCQPIIFAGSGLSRRYFDGPSWVGLLEEMADQCPAFDYDIGRLLQMGKTETEVGTLLAKGYSEWAWERGSDEFPQEYRSPQYDQDIFLKYRISEYLKSISPDSKDPKNRENQDEIAALQEIQPHSIITTNYDQYLEKIFPDYEPIVGEEILRSDYENVGEILKIHGCTSDPQSLRLTDEDYEDFNSKKKYLSAKLLTYFAEHPVLIIGYSATDDNVRKILSDIDKILGENGESADNIYLVDWEEDVSEVERYSKRERITTGSEGYIEVNQITASDFDWVFEAFGEGGNIEGVNLKLLRLVLANTYDIVRTEAPREEVEINYQSLERAANSEDTFGTLFGVSALDDAPDVNFIYRYRLTELAEELGYSSWHYANHHLEQIEEETGVNIKESDNKYHVDIDYHTENSTHRYSDAAVDLLRKVKEGEDWELDLDSGMVEE